MASKTETFHVADGIKVRVFEAGSKVDVGKELPKQIKNKAWLVSFDLDLVEKHGMGISTILNATGHADNPLFEFLKLEAWRVGTIIWTDESKWNVLIDLVETGERESTIKRKATELRGTILAQKGLTKKALVNLARKDLEMRVAYG